jgi:hypothetical protein
VKVYLAIKEDIALAASGPMGSPIVHVWSKVFRTLKLAKDLCQLEHPNRELKWFEGMHDVTEPPTRWRTADYGGSDQYTIEEVDLGE